MGRGLGVPGGVRDPSLGDEVLDEPGLGEPALLALTTGEAEAPGRRGDGHAIGGRGSENKASGCSSEAFDDSAGPIIFSLEDGEQGLSSGVFPVLNFEARFT